MRQCSSQEESVQAYPWLYEYELGQYALDKPWVKLPPDSAREYLSR